MRLFALPALAAVLVCLPSANEIDEVSSPALQRAIEATVPERERLGYTPDDLKHFRFPGRMPAFDAWMADAIAFDAGARDVRGRLRGADGLGAVIETCWTAGGWEIAPDAPVTAAGSLDNVIREWWRARGEEVPEEAIDLALGSLSNEVHPALAHFLVSARACGDQWGRAIDSDRLDAKDIQRLTGRIWELSLDTSQIADLEGGFDRRFAGRAAVRFGAAVEALANALLATDEPRGEGTVTLPTPLGDVVIGAAGDTKHGAPGVLLCVDVSGADTYEPGTACGRLDHPFAAVIDLAGNDEYRSTAARSGAGAGELGVGVVVDCQGDDRYLVEQVATHVLRFDGDGLHLREGIRPADFEIQPLAAPRRAGGDDGAEAWATRKRRARERERTVRRIAAIEEELPALEQRLAELDEAMIRHSEDYRRVVELAAERDRVQREVDGLFGEWEELEERLGGGQ